MRRHSGLWAIGLLFALLTWGGVAHAQPADADAQVDGKKRSKRGRAAKRPRRGKRRAAKPRSDRAPRAAPGAQGPKRSKAAEAAAQGPKRSKAAEAAAQAAQQGAQGEIIQEGDTRVKVMTFSGLDIEGRVMSPQLLYFVNRVQTEFARPKLPHRSFIPEVTRSTQRPPVR